MIRDGHNPVARIATDGLRAASSICPAMRELCAGLAARGVPGLHGTLLPTVAAATDLGSICSYLGKLCYNRDVVNPEITKGWLPRQFSLGDGSRNRRIRQADYVVWQMYRSPDTSIMVERVETGITWELSP